MALLVGYTPYAGIARIRYEGPGAASRPTSQPGKIPSAPVFFHPRSWYDHCTATGRPCQEAGQKGEKTDLFLYVLPEVLQNVPLLSKSLRGATRSAPPKTGSHNLSWSDPGNSGVDERDKLV